MFGNTGKMAKLAKAMRKGEVDLDMILGMAGDIDLAEHPIVNKLAFQVALNEARIAGGMDRVVGAVDPGAGFGLPDSVEERQADLAEALNALSNESFKEWWFSERAPRLMENPETAAKFVGLSKSDWQTQIHAWADQYHGADNPDWVDYMTDAQLADHYARDKYGLTLAQFAQGVVEWNRKQQLIELVHENFAFETMTLHQIADWLESDKVEIIVHEEPDVVDDPEEVNVERPAGADA